MDDKITLTLNSPITEEQWDDIIDVDFEHTDRIWFTTKHGNMVEFVKASAQPQKCSDILEELKADDYYNYIHTGHSRFSEDDWDYIIHNAKEKEKLHERLDKQTGGD